MLFNDYRENARLDFSRPEIAALVPKSAKNILDVGCAYGSLGAALKKRQDCRVTGVEIEHDKAKEAKTKLDEVSFTDIEKTGINGLGDPFDCIIFADVLEHLKDPWATLKNAADSLKPDGLVIASIPNIAHPQILIRLHCDLFKHESFGIMDVSHLRFFTKTTIFQLFAYANLKIKSITPCPNAENPITYLVKAIKAKNSPEKNATTIVIPHCQDLEMLKRAVGSIVKNTSSPHRLIVVTNGAQEETIKWLRDQDNVITIENKHRLGFPIAVNLAMAIVETDYFSICNDDIYVTPDWLHHMVDCMNSDKDMGIVGPTSNYVSGPQQITTEKYNSNTTLETTAIAYHLAHLNKKKLHPRIVFFCVLIKKAVLDKVGILDEVFSPGNFEDDDYCIRARKAGFQNAIDLSTFIHHEHSATWSKNKKEYGEVMQRNLKKLQDKWGSNPWSDLLPSSL